MISRLLLLGLALLWVWPSQLFPQDDTQKRLAELERSQLELKNRLILLEDRLNALLGESEPARVYDIPVGNAPVRGNPDAALTLVVFGDYQSDYCARAQYALNRLLEAYPRELRIVYKQYPLRTLHPNAYYAALAALAAGKRGRFWEMNELLFRNGRVLQPSIYPVLASQIGLDLPAFERDRISLWALERMAEDEKDAVKAEVRGVPALYLNGRRLSAWRLDFVKAQVDRMLGRER